MHRVRVALLCPLFVALACSAPHDNVATSADSLAQAAAKRAANAGVVPWPSFVGSFLAVAKGTGADAVLFRQDTLAMPKQLRTVGYDSTETVVAVREATAAPCATRARLQLESPPKGWSLAIDAANARPVLIDALEDLARADSQRVVVRIQRALNALPDSGAAMEFRGLPVVVRDAWVVHLPTGPVVVARAARLRNLEAASHEELRFVVLESDDPVFVARVAGEEESVESWDLLAALLTPNGPRLAVAREGTQTLQLELVEKVNGSWRSAWRSDHLRCAGPKP